MPKISVIIPVYNTEEYLQQCLDSVLNQTLSDIEVICVDDCSKDRSYEILQNYRDSDTRVKVFHFDEPKSALQARKVGVMESSGDYILFLDADDYLEQDACLKIYTQIIKEDVEILHFSSRVINCANLPQSRINNNQRLLTPCQKRITGSEIFEACFLKHEFFITLWNKLFSAKLCKKAFEYMEDRYLPKAQDLYSFFIISYFAQSYKGWVSEPLHNYCLGRGVVGSSSMNLDKFERYCTQVHVAESLTAFCNKESLPESYQSVIEKYRTQWLNECVNLWKKEIPKELAPEAWKILCRYWGTNQTIACAAKHFWYQRTEVARKLEKLEKNYPYQKQIKTIAFYYYHYTTGGVQRVISILSKMFLKMGYKVVFITDVPPAEEDFPLPDGAVRTTIFDRSKVNNENFIQRLESWDALKDEFQFDMVFYHAWTSNIMLWDFLYLKDRDIPVITHCHSVFSFAVNKFQPIFSDIARVLPVSDGLVVLSDADKVFWDAFTTNVHSIPNPISNELENAVPAKWANQSVIWVGRVSNEKQPWAVFSIMEKVVAQMPDATIYLLGDFDDPKWQKMAHQKGLDNNVVFCGMVQNVNEYYSNASVYLSTSKYEGFPMTLLEAQAHHLPTVMFDMPYLTMGTPARGVIGVDQMDTTAAAAEIVRLLKDEVHWQTNSELAACSYNQLKMYDYEAAWRKVITEEVPEASRDEAVHNMIHTIMNHYEEGLKYSSSQKPKVTYSERKPGTIVITLPKLLAGFIQCCQDHGFLYTLKYGWTKIVSRLRRQK